jgi:RNA polymerase sigma-70 factor (ECF subfamily)
MSVRSAAVDGLTDEQLMAQLQGGHTGALDELYRRYAKKLFVFCYHGRRMRRPEDAEDLVHETFARVIKAAHTFDPGKASFRTWLYTIARNQHIDLVRRIARFSIFAIGDQDDERDPAEPVLPSYVLVDPDADVEGAAVNDAVMEALRECVRSLPDREAREALVLYYLAEKVYREIGEMLGASTSTARNRIVAALKDVRACLARKGIVSFP